MARTARPWSWTWGPLLLAARLAGGQLAAAGTYVLLVNHRSEAVEVEAPRKKTVGPKRFWGGTWTGQLRLASPSFVRDAPEGRYWVVVADADLDGGISAHDTNDLQLELSAAAHACSGEREAGESAWVACLAKRSFGGLPREFVQESFKQLWDNFDYWRLCEESFKQLWDNFDYWRLCEASPPSPVVRTMTSSTGRAVEVIRESPLVATIRGFIGEEECRELMDMAGFDSLQRAPVGASGTTVASEARETLATNLFVDWGKQDTLSRSSVMMFDLASELLGERVPYEGQEPLNFLHYLRGFEYKPHADGSAERRGKRVATTLSYCQAASSGGATVFPGSLPLKFSPGPGDVLFFQYAPDPGAAVHAACPVGAGNKTTLTQWHRLGVSPEQPWDNFEDWGRFRNPHAGTRWRGPRYGGPAAPEPRAEM